jgi:hypothetical protein
LSKNKIVYISDFFVNEVLGGGELNDSELLKILERQVSDIEKIKSNHVTLDILKQNKDSNFIISNFINLKKECKDYITRSCKYVIYEHDHKYLLSRNPAIYKDYKAPNDQLINLEFYKNSAAVLCQSSFHKSIIQKNLNIENIINLSGNLWSTESLQIMRVLNNREKKDAFSIMNSSIPHKNTRETVFYCEQKGFEYLLISSQNYQEFLSLLSTNNKFIFLPKTPETLSRVVVEARMMGMRTFTNKNIGASYEPWYKMKGEELINIMIDKRTTIPQTILEVFNG